MELQKAKDICKLSKKELNSMINSAYKELTREKEPTYKICNYIFEQNGTKSSFLSCNQNDHNTIFLSINILTYYHPLSSLLYAKYPNTAFELMYDDCLFCLKRLIAMLVASEYKIAIRDSFYNHNLTYEILSFLKSRGYDTQLVVFKPGIYREILESIYNYAISLITGLHNVKLRDLTIPITDLLDYLNRSLLVKGYIIDSLVNFSFKQKEDGTPEIAIDINRTSNLLEPEFYDRFEKLANFIECNKRFLANNEYEDLQSKLRNLKNSYYDSIDIPFLVQDKGR